MKDQTIKRTVRISRVSVPFFVVTIVSMMAMGVMIPAPVHAALLNDIVTSPVKTLQDTVSPSTSSSTTSPSENRSNSARPAQSTQTTQPAQSQTPQTSGSTATDSSSTTQSSQTPASTAQFTSPSAVTREPVQEAADQSVTDASPITYVSRQISKNVAASLYVFAAALAVFGLIVYAVTLKPKKAKRSAKSTAKPDELRELVATVALGQLKPDKV